MCVEQRPGGVEAYVDSNEGLAHRHPCQQWVRFLILGMAAIAYVGWSHLGKVERMPGKFMRKSAIPGTELAKMSTDLLRYRNQ